MLPYVLLVPNYYYYFFFIFNTTYRRTLQRKTILEFCQHIVTKDRLLRRNRQVDAFSRRKRF